MQKRRALGRKLYSPRRQERFRRVNGRVAVVNRLGEYCVWAEYIVDNCASLLAISTNREKACRLAQVIAVKRDLAFNRNQDIVE